MEMTCKSCGAVFDDSLVKCPYCGTVNEKGNEAQYMEELEDIRKRLDVVDEESEEVYKAEIKKSTKVIRRTVIIVLIIIGAFGLLFLADKLFTRALIGKTPDPKMQLLWEKENYPKLNALYDAGKYDEALALQDELTKNNEGYNLYAWEHYFALSLYRDSQDLCYYKDELDSGMELDLYEKASTVYLGMKAYEYIINDYYPYTLDEKEKSIVEGFCVNNRDMMMDILKVSEDELEDIYKEIENNGYMSYDKCKKLAEKRF